MTGTVRTLIELASLSIAVTFVRRISIGYCIGVLSEVTDRIESDIMDIKGTEPSPERERKISEALKRINRLRKWANGAIAKEQAILGTTRRPDYTDE